MTPTAYQKPEIRDSNDNIIQQGAFGKNTALSNATNDGWIDYVANDLEALNNNKADANAYLPLTGGTLTGNLNIRTNYPNIRLYNTLIERNVAPSSPYTTVEVCGYDKNTKTTWGLYHIYNTDKANNIKLIAYKGTTTDSSWTGIGVGYDGSGNAYTEAPTPAKSSNNTNIATTAFVKTNLADYLPLSGGTMTGYLTMGTEYIKRSVDDASLTLCGGTSYSNGAYISFNGKDRSSNAGVFSLVANDGTNSKVFYGTPDGTLTWDGHNVITSALTGNILSASGSSTTAGSDVTLCSITNHPAGVWLITSNVRLSTNTNVSYNNSVFMPNHNSRTVRGNGTNGGGCSNVFITELNNNETVTLMGYIPAGTSSTITGVLDMVQLA